MTTISLPNIREPFIDVRSGQISRPWWIWLQQLMAIIGTGDVPDISALTELVRQLLRDTLALERSATDEALSQAIGDLNSRADVLAAMIEAMQRGHGVWEDPDLHAVATTSAAGFMSAADKGVLDGLAAGSVPSTRQVIAGAGLTGGGDLSADRTFNVVANADGSIVVSADDVKVGVLATDTQHGNRSGGALHAAATTVTAGFMSAADKTKLDGLASVSHFLAYQSTLQAIGAGVSTTIVCDTEVFDGNGEYNPATGVFTAAATGTYFFSGRVHGTQGSATVRVIFLAVNGTIVCRMAQTGAETGNGVLSGDSGLVQLTAGDTVVMQYLTGIAENTTTGAALTNFSGWRVR
ncbi:hypothetical protein MNJPNG_04980 [Cupriavidus oxalaticus]|uniref:C1q-like domain-containing protein n=1 Tax=Cupriavidus oxalaticus TaxID=96344 RepID=UPI003F734A86